MRVLGINALFHDPAAALVVDGHAVAAAEEEPVQPAQARQAPGPVRRLGTARAGRALVPGRAGPTAADLDEVAYCFDPDLCVPAEQLGLADPWDWLRVEYARRAPGFLRTAPPGLDPAIARFVPHSRRPAVPAPRRKGGSR